MKIEILIAAMHQTDLSLAKNCNANTDILIINQCDKEDYCEEIYNGHKIRMISTKERGTSNSRNMALDNATGDICIFCDDDVVYNDGYKDAIKNAYEQKKDADIIAFNINLLNPRTKRTKEKITEFKKNGRFKRYGTVHITFKREQILKKQIRFNTLFGPGSGVIYNAEDNLWQTDALNAGLKFYQHPFYIAQVDMSNSTWFEGYNEKYYYSAGAYVCKAFPIMKHILKFYYIYRLRNDKNLSIFQKIKWLNAGIKGIKKELSYEKYLENITKGKQVK